MTQITEGATATTAANWATITLRLDHLSTDYDSCVAVFTKQHSHTRWQTRLHQRVSFAFTGFQVYTMQV